MTQTQRYLWEAAIFAWLLCWRVPPLRGHVYIVTNAASIAPPPVRFAFGLSDDPPQTFIFFFFLLYSTRGSQAPVPTPTHGTPFLSLALPNSQLSSAGPNADASKGAVDSSGGIAFAAEVPIAQQVEGPYGSPRAPTSARRL